MGRRVPSTGRVGAALAAFFLFGFPAAPAPASPSAGAPEALACGRLQAIPLADGNVMCTHGPDPAPDGVDPTVPQPLVGAGHPQGLLFPDPAGGPQGAVASAAPTIACYGDGESGNRVQAIYAVPADRPDRYDNVVGSIRVWAAEMDTVFQQSAAKGGGTRRIRFVTDSGCNLVVERVRLTNTADDSFNNTITELKAQGYNRPDRKYVVWMDAIVLCGIATYFIDDQPGANNANNGRAGVPGSIARIDSGCWGQASKGQSVEAHELMHSLGSVQPSAPNATAAGHCRDDADRMCYQDSPVTSLLTRCPTDQEALFDCDGDDYFSTAPAPGSYLTGHWNTASSSFLSGAATDPTLSVDDASVVEGDAGTTDLIFTVTLSPAASQTATVRFVTGDGTASSTSDYQVAGAQLSFAPGDTAKSVAVPVRGDRLREDDETLTITLFSQQNALVGRTQAVGTIVDNEPEGQGYWFVAADGGIFTYADSKFYGSTGAIRLNQPVVGMARTASGQGYWLVARDGGIFSFGDAPFYGSTGAIRLNQPIVGMTASPTGLGYWFVAADGGIFSYGDARFFGSTGGTRLNRPIVGMAATPTGAGYWLVGADGAVYPFGDAGRHGAPGSVGAPVVGMAATPSGGGYWLAGADGTMYAFGDAPALGSVSGLNRPVVGMAATPSGAGYWLVATDGGIFTFGDARFFGSTGNIKLNQPIVGMAAAAGT